MIATMPCRPDATLALLKSEETVDLFFEGLRLHYIECFAQGRVDDWRKCAHGVCISDAPPFERRAISSSTEGV